MADAVLSEVAALAKLACDTGETASINLTAMPLTRQDREAIETRLGRGEVEATVDAGGRCDVWETAYAGVWFVRYRGLDDRVATEAIEICPSPLILMSHPDDRRVAATRLGEDLRAAASAAA